MTKAPPGPNYFQSFRYFHKATKVGFLEMLTELQETYGDLVKLQAPNGRTLYLVNDPADIHTILQTQSANFVKGASVAPFKVLVGNSLPVSDGEEWRKQRRVLQPPFHRPKLSGYFPQILNTTEEHMDTWLAQKEPVDIVKGAARLTQDIVARSFFGIHLGDSLSQLQVAWEEALQFVYDELHELIKIPLAIPTPRNLKFKKALATVRKTADEMIQSRMGQENQKGEDLLSRLILARTNKDLAGFTDSEIRDQILAFLFAGHETTASNIAWTIYLLLKNPVIQEKVRQEILSVKRESLTLEDLEKFTYLKNVILESLRLYPPAAVFVRESLQETEINGKLIKKGGIILISPYLFHRREDIWPQPLKFDPDRFNDENLKRTGSPKFIAFGYGPRACIGEHFATFEAQIVLIALLQRLQMTLEMETTPKPVFLGTMAPDRIVVRFRDLP